MPHHGIETVAMQDKQPAAIGRDVRGLIDDSNPPETMRSEIAKLFIVIAGNEVNPGSPARLPQYGLNDFIVGFCPIPTALQPPDVDDVAHQIKVIGFGMAKKIEQKVRLTAARTKMDI